MKRLLFLTIMVLRTYTNVLPADDLAKKLTDLSAAYGQDFQSPTLTYIRKYPWLIRNKLRDLKEISDEYEYSFDKEEEEALYRLTNEVIRLENIIHTQHRHSLLHGAPASMHLIRKSYDTLQDNNLDCFVSTEFITDKLTHEERKDTIEYGINWKHHRHMRDRVTFTGYSLFAGCLSESPIDYWLVNKTATDGFTKDNRVPLTIKSIFAQYNQRHLYQKYKSQINALDEEYQKICPRGEVLVFSLRPEAIEKFVYPAASLGRRTDYPSGIDTTCELLTAVQTNPGKMDPYNKQLFCHISAQEPGVAGEEVKVYTATGADPEEMAAYKVKETALFRSIRKYIDDVKRWTDPSYLMETFLP